MWWVAARRYENGLVASPSLTDRHVHQLYRQTPSWIPSWLGVHDNPIFLRELASQLRSGAGRWPGYAVFVTLFLAPFLYSQSWNVRRTSEMNWSSQAQLQPAVAVATPSEVTTPGSGTTKSPFIRLHSFDGTELRLKGHTNCACLRMGLYQKLRVPLPASAVVKVEYRSPLQMFQESGDDIPAPGPKEVELSRYEAASYGIAVAANDQGQRQLSSSTLEQIRAHSMSQGLLGCLVLLALYLGVRCSGFLANAVTSECDRRSWTDLALTGIGPEQVVQGKLAGTLLMPVIQLLVAAPSLLLFVFAGAISPLGALQLVAYAVMLAVTAGLMGFWASSASPTSHQAQGLALVSVMAWLLVTPFVSAAFGHSLLLPFLGLGLLAAMRQAHRLTIFGWLALAGSALVNPLGLSPWTCLPLALTCGFGQGACALTSITAFVSGVLALAGISALCYSSTLANLQQPGQEDALRADRIV
jgi:hypothetical protein